MTKPVKDPKSTPFPSILIPKVELKTSVMFESAGHCKVKAAVNSKDKVISLSKKRIG